MSKEPWECLWYGFFDDPSHFECLTPQHQLTSPLVKQPTYQDIELLLAANASNDSMNLTVPELSRRSPYHGYLCANVYR